MKKISILVLILIIFNFIWTNYFVFADTPSLDSTGAIPESETESPEETEATAESSSVSSGSMADYKRINEEGIVNIGGNQKKISLGESDVGDASSKVGTALTTIASVGLKVISQITNEGGFYNSDSNFSAEKTGLFTVNSLIFNEYMVFNPKIYEKSTDLNPEIEPQGVTKQLDGIKQKVYDLSKLLTYIATGFGFPVLIFSIVKWLTSKTATDLAVWKKVLGRWLVCVILVLGYHYIFIFIDTIADIFINYFWKIRTALETSGYQSFETTIIYNLSEQLANTGGVTSLGYSVVFCAIVVVQIIFLLKYITRMFAIMLLFMLAPVMIMWHSIKLMLGKDTNILSELFKNYISLVFMQVLHILFYLVFLFSLSEVAINAPVLGIVLLYAIFRAEDISKAMFGWELGSSIFSLKK